ncbi:hypothetical protein acsn021_22840 [Anaerocolumna cellulosilytica]|uniref:Glycosyl hydrolase-like 10 domain-containing protein n=1 Tax=Anaerocolumna cellulosilytica TaxID=433286 RepID=A0A6S6R5W7_9FIRM|nr:hypothetical protein acsn021_22840 [Anaerocolumna cellulosilytica]
MNATDASGIKTVKWATGNRKVSYFKSNGTNLTLSKNNASVTIAKNGTYTFYAIDKAGNEAIKKLTISTIDIIAPSLNVTKSTEDLTKGNVVLNFTVSDEGLGIKSLRYLIGSKTENDFKNAGKVIKLTRTSTETEEAKNIFLYSGRLTVKTNNTFTFLVIDSAGNTYLTTTNVENIDKTAPTLTYTLNTSKPTNQPVTVTITGTDNGSGIAKAQYLTGSKTITDFGDTSDSAPIDLKLDANGKSSFKTDTNNTFTVLLTDNAGNETLQMIDVTNIDTKNPTISLNYAAINQAATITYTVTDAAGIASVRYLKGTNTDISSDKWNSAKDVTKSNNFKVTSAGNYSIMVEDLAGNRTIQEIYVELELKAVWISFLEFQAYGKNGYTEANFKKTIDTMFDNIVDLKMNAVIVQVRPFGDAMYPSAYFPWSKYISGTQGKDPGFDPLKYMVTAAHDRGLEIHAWLNPYRVTTSSTDFKSLSKDNPARMWREDKDTSNDRNVLSFGGNLYYNPAVKEVQELITNGIKEIVTNYDVDGIHFDDYFYPSLGSKYASNFDSVEYKAYTAECKTNGTKALGIADWRRNNVNTLVKNVYSSIKAINPNVQFGISPGGFIDSLASDLGYYVDVKTWLSSDGYIDYICPQIYWTFSHKTYPFDKTLDKWLSYRTSSSVKVYVGIANYRAGSTLETDWKNDPDVLKKQIEYSRKTGKVDGFMFFRYDFFYNKVCKPGVDRLLKIL